jgi:proteasome lid subunit RPN8/RPN11
MVEDNEIKFDYNYPVSARDAVLQKQEDELIAMREKPVVLDPTFDTYPAKDWKEYLKMVHRKCGLAEKSVDYMTYSQSWAACERFYTEVWNVSMNAFDVPREVQVVIDDNDVLHSSVGTPSFVSFQGDEGQLHGLKLPIKCWIHTHPFGRAYFSGTDWKTIKTWRDVMSSCVVLGDNMFWSYNTGNNVVKKVSYSILKEPQYVHAEFQRMQFPHKETMYTIGGEKDESE